MNVIDIRGLTKRYGKTFAVDRLDMHVAAGDIYGFVGKNGAGKSTTMKMVAGLATPSAGQLALFGEDRSHVAGSFSGAPSRIGALIEEPGVLPNFSATENMMMKALAMGVVRPREQVDDLLQLVGLEGVGPRRVKKFSLGMKQRLGLALALMNRPDLLLLDEPINGLDPEGIVEFRNLLLRLNQERQTTILISSHILSELANLATCYGFLDNGMMLEQISARALEEKCRACIEARVDDASRAALVLEQSLGIRDYEVLPGHLLRIYSSLDAPHRVAQALVEGGVALQSIESRGANLEDYFLSMIGGVRHA